MVDQIIPRLVNAARTSIYNSKNTAEGIATLRKNLANGPMHVFGCHKNCGDFCTRKDLGERDWTCDKDFFEFFNDIKFRTDLLVKKARSLVYLATTNAVESMYAVFRKFQGGKRKNLYQRGQYHRRVIAASIAVSRGPQWSLRILRRMFKHTPNKIVKKMSQKREKRRCSRTLRFQKDKKAGRFRKRRHENAPADENYGDIEGEPDISDEALQAEKEKILKKLALEVATADDCARIERATTDQRECPLWQTMRAHRLTASIFGTICKHQSTTSCHNKIRDLFIKKKKYQYIDLNSIRPTE
jgi:hypothetical protein